MTKTADLGMPEINEIVSKVNTTALSGAMQANYSLPDKQNLTVHMVFYHQKYIGALELKNENTLTTDQYVQAWKTTHNTGNHILFLFTWNESNNLYEHKKLDVSPAMETNHLFTEVMNFIRANLSGSSADIVEKGTRYLANAIRPVWTAEKRQAAEDLANLSKNKSNRINKGYGGSWFDFTYLNLRPANSSETEGMAIVAALDKNKGDQGFETANMFLSNQYIFTNDDELIAMGDNALYRSNISFEKEGISNMYFFYGGFIYRILKHIEETGMHNAYSNASEWSWTKTSNGIRQISSFNDFSEREDVDRLILFSDPSPNSQEGEEIPILSTHHGNTWCNVFASDMSRDILFPDLFSGNPNQDTHAPWGKHACANRLHYRIHNSVVFVKLENNNLPDMVKVWKYVERGYPVYLTRFGNNPDNSLEATNESKIDCRPSGHIAVGFNHNNNTVIHVGGSSYDETPVMPWNGAQKANLYLGYILNLN